MDAAGGLNLTGHPSTMPRQREMPEDQKHGGHREPDCRGDEKNAREWIPGRLHPKDRNYFTKTIRFILS
jgi:hypothetical protein